MQDASQITHALSFDIEDWFHIVEVPSAENPADWPSFPSIVETRTRQIVDLLRDFDVKATFFILGWIAERYPQVVRMIADAGHEVGTHSFWHRRVYELTPDTFHEDLVDSIAALKQAADVEVYGFRAPSFSITPGTEWAFDVIRKVGLQYDASLFPAPRAHGGYACEPGPHLRYAEDSGPLAELPMSVFHFGPMRLCYSGGGYFRLFPSWFIRHGMRQAAREGRPAVFYLHPRDFATDCPRAAMPLYRRFKCYVGQRTTERKLRRLLRQYRFAPCREVLQQRGLLPDAIRPVEAEVS